MLNIYLKVTNDRYFMIKTHYFSQFRTKMWFCCKILSLNDLPRVRSVDREPIVYDANEPTRVQTCDDDKSLFPAKPALGRNGIQFSILMYPDHFQNWFKFGHGLGISFLALFCLRETSQTSGFSGIEFRLCFSMKNEKISVKREWRHISGALHWLLCSLTTVLIYRLPNYSIQEMINDIEALV